MLNAASINMARKTKVRREGEKKSKQEIVEAENLIEESSLIFSECIRCGMCKSLCPIFKHLREEVLSPRGHSILLSEKIVDDLVFKCNLCRACENTCPIEIKICEGILKAREALVLKGSGLKENEEMIENIRKTGSPFGKKSDNKEKLYCC